MISEELVEASWDEVNAFTAPQAQKYMSQLGRRQRELLTFVVTMTEDLSHAAHETAIYAFAVIYRMFERASGPLPRARRQQIVAAYEKVSDELERLLGADHRFLERHALASMSHEPFVMRYVSEILLEPDSPEGKVPDDDAGAVFMCLKAVVDVLHDIAAAR